MRSLDVLAWLRTRKFRSARSSVAESSSCSSVRADAAFFLPPRKTAAKALQPSDITALIAADAVADLTIASRSVQQIKPHLL